MKEENQGKHTKKLSQAMGVLGYKRKKITLEGDKVNYYLKPEWEDMEPFKLNMVAAIENAKLR